MARLQRLAVAPEAALLEVLAGTDVTIEAEILDDGVASDISADTVEFTAKDAPGGEVVKIATKANGPGDHSTPEEGKTRFTLTAAELALTDPTESETWWFEVRRTREDGSVIVHAWGRLVVRAAVGTDAA